MNNTIEINSYFFIITILIIIFASSIYLIKFVDFIVENLEKKESDKIHSTYFTKSYINPNQVIEKYSSFILPIIALISFFISCFFISKVLVLIDNQGHKKYAGIYFIFVIALILVIYNNTILQEEKIKKYIKGKKFSVIGMIMVLGVSALIFGFIDNFGLKLGIEALDNKFLNLFLGQFSIDKRFVKEKKSITKNLEYMNNWANGKWRAVLNQTLRFKEDIRKIKHPKINDLMEDIDKLIEDGGLPLDIPKNIKERNIISEYITNIKSKYDVIEGSKAMMGNTFSNIIGSLLSSALINLFIYMTKYDGTYSGDDDIDENFWVKNINRYLPFLEGFFIAVGCIIPIFLNIAMTRDNFNTNNRNAWLVLGIISMTVCVMLFLSVRGARNMNTKNKENSIKKTLSDMKDRLDISQDKDIELNNKIDNFINNL
jgi:hypothetical protein